MKHILSLFEQSKDDFQKSLDEVKSLFLKGKQNLIVDKRDEGIPYPVFMLTSDTGSCYLDDYLDTSKEEPKNVSIAFDIQSDRKTLPIPHSYNQDHKYNIYIPNKFNAVLYGGNINYSFENTKNIKTIYSYTWQFLEHIQNFSNVKKIVLGDIDDIVGNTAINTNKAQFIPEDCLIEVSCDDQYCDGEFLTRLYDIGRKVEVTFDDTKINFGKVTGLAGKEITELLHIRDKIGAGLVKIKNATINIKFPIGYIGDINKLIEVVDFLSTGQLLPHPTLEFVYDTKYFVNIPEYVIDAWINLTEARIKKETDTREYTKKLKILNTRILNGL